MLRLPEILASFDPSWSDPYFRSVGRIRHMPVVDDGTVVGIVSQRDLFLSALVIALGFGRKTQRAVIKTMKIKEIMTEHVITTSPDASVKEATRMIDKKIGCLPVVDGENVIGLLTETDILRYFAEH